jgi:hypothetical protein
MDRRGFLTGLVSALAAPAIIRPGLLMPIKPLLIRPNFLHITPFPISNEIWELDILYGTKIINPTFAALFPPSA